MLPRGLDDLPALLRMPEAAWGHTATAPTPRQGRIINPAQSTQQPLLHLGRKGGHVGKIRTKHLSRRNLLYFLLYFLLYTFCHSWKCIKWLP